MNIIKRDIKDIFLKSMKLSPLYLILLIVCEVYFLSFKEFSIFQIFFNGVVRDVGYINNFQSFSLPAFWLLFQLVPTFIVTLSIYNDHIENGSYNILKMKSRSKYFISKVLAGFFVIFVMNFALYILVFLNMIFFQNLDRNFLITLTRMISSYVIVEFILFFMAFLISILTNFKFGVTSILVQLTLSMTTNFKYFIGQQSLAFKQDIFGGYISLKDCLITWGAYLVVAILVSYFVFRSYDFCGGKND